ncbi:MAG: response regulator transcription factor [Anaerolineae bacterium]|jgi:two-component system KDP operon response regulator KdpE|nr:response regulator transcription factor [Anaerolineae bacterium]
MDTKKILVIDDDPGLVTLLRLGLERDGFAVYEASNGKEGLRMAYEIHPDVILLDIMMPEMDGWSACQRLRSVCDTPIIVLSAKAGQADVVRGLTLGADDYVTKPCSFNELKARIKAVLRRQQVNEARTWQAIYDDGFLYVNLADGTVLREGERVNLTPTEQRLLMALISQKGHVIEHRELLVSIWGPQYAEEVGYLSVYIRYLRQKLEKNAAEPVYIRTQWGKGYYFGGEGPLRAVDEGPLRFDPESDIS